ncbi:acyl-CoA dehydrogenase family protein [Streptomyces sp. NPDC058964]|uniref:acyl-CoA dehydrogenase family protein n=1 Tax=Streptomyces sp. NPDC058964 TaxID=3346681 RepID=UPI00369E627D
MTTATSWAAAADLGLFTAPVPVQLGGSGTGYQKVCSTVAAMAEDTGISGPPFALSAHLWAFQSPVVEFGSPTQHEEYLSRSLAGELVGAFAGTEPEAGSDLLSLRTRAERDEPSGGWVLSGTKTFVTNGPLADVFLVLARTADGSALGGLTAFLIPRETPGLEIGAEIPKTALPGARFNLLRLDGCRVADGARLGRVGSGFAVLMHAMRYERAFILAPTIGLMSRALRLAVGHARERVQFGRSIGSYDAVRGRIVQMHLSLTSAREFLEGTARLADAGHLDHGRASLTKLHVSAEFNTFCDALPDVYGGYALLPENGTVQLLADAVASRYYSGTTDMQIKVIAEGLGL